MVSFYFAEYFAGTVSAQGLLGAGGDAEPCPAAGAVPAARWQPPLRSPRGPRAPLPAALRPRPAACAAARAPLTRPCPDSIPALPPLQRILEPFVPRVVRDELREREIIRALSELSGGNAAHKLPALPGPFQRQGQITSQVIALHIGDVPKSA